MKNFSRLVFASLLVLAFVPAFSQLSGGADLAIPSGNLSNSATVGLGLSLRYDAPIEAVKNLSWTASAGFITFLGKSYTTGGYKIVNGVPVPYTYSTSQSSTVIPLVGGAKYYFQKQNEGFYGAFDLGIYLATGAYSSTYFGAGPGIGYRMNQWDFTGRINFVSDVTFLGLRGAYIFGK
jgi:hypothetical protein